MRNQIYELETAQSFATYEFVSKGPKGHIRKLVKYTELGNAGIFNLGFGDKLGDSDDFDDKVISDNKDSLKVLATAVATIYQFTDKFPYASIFATGSTLARTRLYRIGISNALEEIEKDFNILGFFDGQWETFEKNKDYSAFSITRK